MPERAAAPSSSQPESTVPDARARRITRTTGGLLLLAMTLWMLRSYLTALCWAVIIAISVWPLYRRVQARLEDSRIAAPLLMTSALALLLVTPLALVLTEVGREGQIVMGWLTQLQQNGMPVPASIQHLPILGQQLNAWWQTHLGQPQSAQQFLSSFNSQTLAEWSKTLGGALLSRVLQAFLTFLTLFMLLREGEQIGGRVLTAIDRWFGTPGERLAETMTEAVRGTVNGTILVAIGEGILIGIGFFVAGVPNAALFTVLTTAFAMLPMGAWLAFGTAAIILVLSGGAIAVALAVFAWGAAVMLIGDNIVQPALVGGAVRLPFLWTLFGILGGLETFGLIGLFLGPVLMAALLTIWKQQSKPALSNRLPTHP
ncbi:AI-2E family transporter [Microvirga sp. G4-2]|uniref:AI-2E family transporter n=1 Tax=Microvirga sp. G4-2 TaxID=3434467 RepID=UPI0040439F32